jgi:excisionase family DNA binding protein
MLHSVMPTREIEQQQQRGLTIRQAARRWNVSERTIWNLLQRRPRLAVRPRGLRIVRVDAQELDDVMRGQ